MRTTVPYKERELLCQMTTEEYAAKSKEMVDWMNAISQMEDKIEAVKNAYKQPIKDAEEKVDGIRLVLNSGSISRKVSIAKIYDWERGCCYERRCDNGEVVPGSWHMMTESERQTDSTHAACPDNWNLTPAEVVQLTGKQELLALPDNSESQPAQDAEYEEVVDQTEETIDETSEDGCDDAEEVTAEEDEAHA